MRTFLLLVPLAASLCGQYPVFGPVTVESRGTLAPQAQCTSLSVNPCFFDTTYLGGVSGTSIVFTLPCPLEPLDTNGMTDVYVRDFATGVTQLVSTTSAGGPANGCSVLPRIAGGGRYVVFATQATDILPGMSGFWEIVFKDLQTGAQELISIGLGGVPANAGSGFPDVSDDGRFVVFSSVATNLIAGDTEGQGDIFLRDRLLGTTIRVSQDPMGTGGSGGSTSPRISGDGSAVLFHTHATNLPPSTPPIGARWLVYDVGTQNLEVVSVSNAGSQSGVLVLPSGPATISDAGRYVAFRAGAALEPGAPLGAIYVRDRVAQSTEIVVRSSAGTLGNGTSFFSDISGDGRFVAFTSQADNLVPDDTNGLEDVFVRDRVTGTTLRINTGPRGAQGDGTQVLDPALDETGRRAGFVTDATTLVQRPLCNSTAPSCALDVFLADLGPGENLGFATEGSGGVPYLRLVEQAAPFPWTLALRFGAPNAPALLAFASSPGAPLPLPGGTIVPWPPDLVLSAVTDAKGSHVIPFHWSPAIPPGFQVWCQAAIVDPLAMPGFALSNAHVVQRP